MLKTMPEFLLVVVVAGQKLVRSFHFDTRACWLVDSALLACARACSFCRAACSLPPLLPARPRFLRACIRVRAPLHCRTIDCAHVAGWAPFCCCRFLSKVVSLGILFSVELDLLLLVVDILLKLKARCNASCRCVVP